MEKIYYFQGQQVVRSDSLSEFLESCGIIPKSFGYQHTHATTGGTRLIGDMELIYYIGGESVVTINDTVYRCHAGDVVIIPQYVLYKIDTTDDNPHVNFWLHFDIGDIVNQKRLMSLVSDSYISHIGVNDELISLYNKLRQEFSCQTSGSRAMIESLVTQILIKIIRLAETGTGEKEGITSDISDRSHAIIERCVRYITEKKGMVSVSDVCRDMFISPSYIRRLFVRAFGIPPSELIRIIRLREAEIMLLSTDMSVSDISAALGYSSPYHFSGDFSRRYGKSPTAYRKSRAV